MCENNLKRVASVIPLEGLSFSIAAQCVRDWLMYPGQIHGFWVSDIRIALRECVKRKWLRFENGKYYPVIPRPMPLPPVRLAWDIVPPEWPEQALIKDRLMHKIQS